MNMVLNHNQATNYILYYAVCSVHCEKTKLGSCVVENMIYARCGSPDLLFIERSSSGILNDCKVDKVLIWKS